MAKKKSNHSKDDFLENEKKNSLTVEETEEKEEFPSKDDELSLEEAGEASESNEDENILEENFSEKGEEISSSKDSSYKKQNRTPKELEKKGSDKGKKQRKMTAKIAALVTAIVTVIVVLLNVVVSTLNNTQNLRFDLTAQKSYELNISTLQYLNNLDTEVEIIVLTDEKNLSQDIDTGGYFSQVNAILRGMESANSNIHLSYQDLEKNIDLQTRFKDITLVEGSILVVHENQKIQLNMVDLFNTQQYYNEDGSIGTYIASSKAEQVLLSSIFSVINENPITVTFISGVSDASTHSFQNLLKLNGYVTEERSFLEENWWENADILVLRAPQQDLTEQQATELSTFLQQKDKTLLYFAPKIPTEPTPRLNAILAEWGLAVDESAVYETDSNNFVTGNEYFTYAQYSEDAFGASLEDEDGARVLLAQTHPIELLYAEDGNHYTAPLLTFLDTAKAYVPGSSETDIASIGDLRGPFNGAAMGAYRFEEEDGYAYSQIIAFGSESAADEAYLSTTLADNSAYFIRLLKALYPDSAPELVIEEKTIDPAQLDISTSQQQGLGLVFMGIVPVVFIMTGILERVRRNRL